MAKQVSKKEFDELTKSGKTVLVDFFATWCGPCQMMEPIIEELSDELKENKDIVIVKVDIDEEPELPARYTVMGVPTFLVIKDGKEVARQVGATTKENLSEKIKLAK